METNSLMISIIVSKGNDFMEIVTHIDDVNGNHELVIPADNFHEIVDRGDNFHEIVTMDDDFNLSKYYGGPTIHTTYSIEIIGMMWTK